MNTDHQLTGEDKHMDMLALVTHDLKSPINAILGALSYIDQLAQEETVDIAEIQHIAKIAQSASYDMLDLVHGIVTMARIEAEKEQLDLDRVKDLPQVMHNIVATFRFEAALGKKNLRVEIAQSLPEVCWDIKKIRYHVLNNVVSNALKFLPSGGTVAISAHADQHHVYIRIADNGPGIPPAERPKIFDKFKRLEVSSTRVHHGTGLGLYTAHLFTRLHQGAITMEDGLDGKGIAFVIKLPLLVCPEDASGNLAPGFCIPRPELLQAA